MAKYSENSEKHEERKKAREGGKRREDKRGGGVGMLARKERGKNE